MREIHINEITDTVRELCIKSNIFLSDDIKEAISKSIKEEKSDVCKDVFSVLEENIKIAEEKKLPVCQDTGMAVVFAEIGQEVHITGGLFADAVNEGVRRGYIDGFLRCSVVSDPLIRVNTNDNTPAILHQTLVSGDKIKITVAPKGFGSENMSRVKMFTPSAKEQDIIDFVTDTVKKAGSNPCPPIVVGVGMGGDFEYCAILAKKALLRPINQNNPDEYYCSLENKMLKEINDSNIGAQGFGGSITALGVNIEKFATHIAGLPVAVNISCHVTRHMSKII